MKRLVGALVLSVGLLAPTAVMVAQDHDRDHQTHVWADSEDPHWRQYLAEHHKKYHDWAKAKKKEQQDYWKWRDAHPDAH